MKQRQESLIPGLAPEGLTFVFSGAALLVACLVVPRWVGALIFAAYTAFAVWFFRDPERYPPPGDDTVLSPADGRVVDVEDIQKAPYTGEPARKVGIFMSGFDVHVNRNPISGRVEGIYYKQGGFIKADLAQASLLNEQNAILLRRDDGVGVMFIQVAGLVARRIVCYLEIGDRVERGARMGMIRFGSRLDVYVSPDTEISVQKGDKVRAGETVLGTVPWS